jgi:hypothetical protein
MDVTLAEPHPLQLSIEIEVDERLVECDVLDSVAALLLDKDRGLLAPERIGIGVPLYRSQLIHQILSVPGAISVNGVSRLINGNPEMIVGLAIAPGDGRYFDILGVDGKLLLNGREYFNG